MSALESEPFVYSAEIPREIAEIANRACARVPSERYPSAVAFQQALESFLAHQQVMALAQKGIAHLTQLKELLHAHQREPKSEERGREIHRLYAEARFALTHALGEWPALHEAQSALSEANRHMMEHSLSMEDLSFATYLLPECQDESLRLRVKSLRDTLEARAKELDKLREEARRSDWSAVSSSLGSVFLFGGFMGALACLMTGYTWRSYPNSYGVQIFFLWVIIIGICGAFAWATLRRTKVPDSLVSSRMMGLWGTISVACTLNFLITVELGIPRASTAAGGSMLFAVGFAVMSFQARRWLLIPSLLFAVASLLIPRFGAYGVDVFGGFWLLALGAIGAAFKAGASLEAPTENNLAIESSSTKS